MRVARLSPVGVAVDVGRMRPIRLRRVFKATQLGIGSRGSEERDGWACVKCGTRRNLSVNRIEPRNGQCYGRGCHHHLSNLETLCQPCHVGVTNAQRRARQEGMIASPTLTVERTK